MKEKKWDPDGIIYSGLVLKEDKNESKKILDLHKIPDSVKFKYKISQKDQIDF